MIRYINENIHKIDGDVDLILNHFKKYFDKLKEGIITSINSDNLVSSESIKANSKNNIDIVLIVSNDTSCYDVVDNKIFINIPIEYLNNKLKLDKYLDNLDLIIYHELNHWIDNIFYKYQITKIVNRNNHKDSNYYEINSQIIMIKALKEKTENYNELTFIELIDSLFYTIAKYIYDFGGKIDFNKWLLNVFHRMDREKILGKNMKYLFTFEELNEFHRI